MATATKKKKGKKAPAKSKASRIKIVEDSQEAAPAVEERVVRNEGDETIAVEEPDAAKTARVSKADKARKAAVKLGALEAAAEVLAGAEEPLSAKQLIEAMAKRKLWSSPGGKTPDQTLAAAIGTEIARKGKESRFTKPAPGRFALK